MANWRQLGEVPDSEDDDSFDSLDEPDLLSLPTASVKRRPLRQRLEQNEKDIWEIPSSPQDGVTLPSVRKSHGQRSLSPQEELNLISSPLSALSTPFDSSQSLPPIEELVPRPDSSHERAELQISATVASDIPQDDISVNSVRITSLIPLFQGPENVLDSIVRPQGTTPLQSQVLGDDTDAQDARRLAVRYERSLRHRKPEQLQPYSMERARYNNDWKRAGIRPLRIVHAEPARHADESSEGDYEPESQGSNRQIAVEESQQGEDGTNLNDGGFHFGMLSSSPPRTSPLDVRLEKSSQTSSRSDTDNTSVLGDDLPAVEALTATSFKRSIGFGSAKRRNLLSQSAARKRKRIEPHGTPQSPLRRFVPPPQSPDPFASPPGSPIAHVRKSLHSAGKPQTSSARGPSPTGQPSVLALTDDELGEEGENVDVAQETIPLVLSDVSSSDAGIESNDGSDNEPEVVNHHVRRIRGVLPASWLRLDQQSSRSKAEKTVRRDKAPIETEQRRGVAQRHRGSGGTSNVRTLTFDESEEEDVMIQRPIADDTPYYQSRLPQVPSISLRNSEPGEMTLEDDDASVVEEDHIDHMSSGRKRQLKLSDAFSRQSKRSKTVNRSEASRRHNFNQTQLHDAFNRPKASSLQTKRPKKQAQKSRSGLKPRRHGAHGSREAPTRTTAPRLSVLDIIEPDAPRFLKIAARTAKQRPGQGRGSLTKKHIQLAARADQVDVISFLQSWRAGTIKQRPSVTRALTKKPSERSGQPLTETSNNTRFVSNAPLSSTSQGPRNFTKHTTSGGIHAYCSKHEVRKTQVVQPGRSEEQRERLAVLETDSHNDASTVAFHARKKQLDRLFHQKYSNASIAGSILSVAEAESHSTAQEQAPNDSGSGQTPLPRPLMKTKFRKRNVPRRVNTQAPQYSHASDPLPASNHPQVFLDSQQVLDGGKLLGLGPYGTEYTRHFETFPLGANVYFHSSTLMGSGILERIECGDLAEQAIETRPHVLFQLGNRTLRWGLWSSQVSSELGILSDALADQLHGELPSGNHAQPLNPVDAAGFVLNFVMNSLTWEEMEAKSVFTRIPEVLRSISSRIEGRLVNIASQSQQMQATLQVYDRLLLVSVVTLRLCRGQSSLVSEQFQLEDCLRHLAKTTASLLVCVGVDDMRKTYEHLQTLRSWERGLKENMPVIHSWVVLMQVLEMSNIPRCSFWDIAQDAIAISQPESFVQAQDLERLWESMFVLLPLTEFGNAGVMIPGLRRPRTTDGWTLPRKLLKRVFDLYKHDARQSPSFNNYCRALVGRCHYLVKEWGWYKSASAIGVIFDFFGSQSLAHLRNEESHSSPRFLEELALRPSLNVELEDKCFHVFLKLVAITVQELKERKATKDITNLIKRTTPNHNRQYLKEQTIHERDLAALRNHHDLLCTLYWASPPELRSNVDWPERLVVPQSSHKEACLINFRTWSQLARFIVASGEATTSLKPFNQWRNNFFQDMMHQYDSVASDIDQQFKELSKDVSKSISSDMLNAMVAANKAAVVDVLHFSIVASLDVLKHVPDLEAASFAFNPSQLHRVFHHFSTPGPELDWGILRASLATLEQFLTRVDYSKLNEQESESQILNSAQVDDALLVLDQIVMGSFFSMARRLLSDSWLQEDNAAPTTDRASCTEHLVKLAARMGNHFIEAGLIDLRSMFKAGKYGLFSGAPHALSLEQRSYLPLFLTTILQNGFDDFSEPGFTLLELWIQALVKPQCSLRYEHRLAEELVRQKKEFVPQAGVALATEPDYGTNRDLFEYAISSMRTSIYNAGPSLKQILQAEHSRALKLVMQQMKDDLQAIAHDSIQQSRYVTHVRDIVSQIRAHGADITPVDDYFYQMSSEYSPSEQDPKLQVAGMKSYGLRIEEGDTRSETQLFFFMFNNLKMAVIHDKMSDEVRMLRLGIKDKNVRNFVLGKMLPAVVKSIWTQSSATPLVDVYVGAMHHYLLASDGGKQFVGDDLPHLFSSLKALADVMLSPHCFDTERQHLEMIHIKRQCLALLNAICPSLLGTSVSNLGHETWAHIKELLKALLERLYTRDERFSFGNIGLPGDYQPLSLHSDIISSQRPLQLSHDACVAYQVAQSSVDIFCTNIVADISKSWVERDGRLTFQGPAKGSMTQPGQGIEQPDWEYVDVMLNDVHQRAMTLRPWLLRLVRDVAPPRPPVEAPMF